MKRPGSEAIAVIGMACRFPGGANDPGELWNMLEQGRDATGPIPKSRFEIDEWYDADPEKAGRISTRRGGFLDCDIRSFDANFFDIPPAEAETMDPQIRLLLELGYEALEDAGQDLARLAGGAHGVYAGICFSEYQEQLTASANRRPLDSFFICGTNSCSASGRLSYHFGFEGPSLTLNAACSSSLLGVHLACRDLVSGEVDLALAGGVNLMLSPETFVGFSRLRVLSPDGRCKAFDASADGYARSEGAGLVCLKRLEDAIADGDRVLAVIEGTAVTNDGAARGYTAPRPEAQEKAIRKALSRAGVTIDAIDVIEAHGTGTRLGDRLEVQALSAVLASRDPALTPVRIGAVKSNFGHAEAAAGIASLMKMVLALQARRIPAHLNFQTPNPAIAWPDNLTVNTATSDWTTTGRRRAGINSFGMSGVNVHVIVAEAETAEKSQSTTVPAQWPIVLPLSARSPEALQTLGKSWLAMLGGLGNDAARRLAASQSCRRTVHRNRLTAVGWSVAELRSDLARRLEADPPDIRARIDVGLLFAGSASGPEQSLRSLESYRVAFEAARARATGLPDAQAEIYASQHGLAAQLKAIGITPKHVGGLGLGRIVGQELRGEISVDEALAAIASAPVHDAEDAKAEAQKLAQAGAGIILQVGGRPAQRSLTVIVPGRDGKPDEFRTAAWLPALADDADAVLALVKARAGLHDHGADLPPHVFHADPGAQWEDTPRYPWQKQVYWVEPSSAALPSAPAAISMVREAHKPATSDDPLQDVCVALGSLLGMPPARIDPDLPMASLGLDSLMAVSLVARLGHGLSPTVLWSHPTARKLTHHLGEKLGVVPADAAMSRPRAPTGVENLEAELDDLLERLGG